MPDVDERLYDPAVIGEFVGLNRVTYTVNDNLLNGVIVLNDTVQSSDFFQAISEFNDDAGDTVFVALAVCVAAKCVIRGLDAWILDQQGMTAYTT